MVNGLRQKAREVKAAGVAERGNFNPTGVPLKMYKYWLDNSGSDKARRIRSGSRRENFCHFWRVVAIWAPLMFLASKAEAFITSKTGIVATIAFVVIGLVIGSVVSGGFAKFLGLFLLSVTAAMMLVVVCVGIVFFVEKHWRSSWTRAVGKIAPYLAVGTGVCLLIGLIVFLVVSRGWLSLLLAIGFLAGVIAIAFAIAFGLSQLTEYIAGRRSLKHTAERNARYDYFNEYGRYPEAEPTQPNTLVVYLTGFFSGLADFLILITQIVRVKKWKICPMVEINQNLTPSN